VGAGDDRAQRDKVALDEHPDVLVHLELKVREGSPKVRVVPLEAGPASRPVQVVGEKPAVDQLIDARVIVRVDGIEEGAHELVRALRCGRCVESVETRDRGRAHRRYRLCCQTFTGNKAKPRRPVLSKTCIPRQR
jgi:hypothetical protein